METEESKSTVEKACRELEQLVLAKKIEGMEKIVKEKKEEYVEFTKKRLEEKKEQVVENLEGNILLYHKLSVIKLVLL